MTESGSKTVMTAKIARWRGAAAIAALTAVTIALIALAARPGQRAGHITSVGHPPPGLEAFELSYEETPSGRCLQCGPTFLVRTRGPHVTLTCSNCAIGEVSFNVPSEEIQNLIAEFVDGGFLGLPLEANAISHTHSTLQKLSYRDAKRVHEVAWWNEAPNRLLERLRQRLLSVGRTEYFFGMPAYEVIRTSIESRSWFAQPQSLAFLAWEGDELAVGLLLEHHVEITDDVLRQAASGGNLRVAEMILAKVDRRRRETSVGTMLVAASRHSRTEPISMVTWLLSQPGSAAYHDDAVRQALEWHRDDVVELLRRERGR